MSGVGPDTQDPYDYDADGNLWLEYSRELDSFQDPSVNIYDQTRSYHSIDGKLSVVNRHIGISAVSDESHSGRHQVYQENWYDALGRRVMVRARKSSNCSNATHGDLACKSYVERTVWDGDQILIENRMNGASGLCSSELDYNSSGSSEAWGQVLSVHAHGIDQPVVVRKPGHTSIAPHANWMGDYEIGTTANGTVTTSCNGASNCPLILWPGSRQTVDGQLVSHSAINTWWGTLITEKTDPSGYKYMRNRYYNPQTGQFTQADPIGLAGGMNLYGFAEGDPVNFDDPFGLGPLDRLRRAVEGMMILVTNLFGSPDNPIKEAFKHATSKPAIHAVAEEAAADAARVHKNVQSRGTGNNPPPTTSNLKEVPQGKAGKAGIPRTSVRAITRGAAGKAVGAASYLWPTPMGDGTLDQK